MVRKASFLYTTVLAVVSIFLFVALLPHDLHLAFAATDPCGADITSDGSVNISDYSALVRDFLRSPLLNPRSDITGDGAVNISDYSVLVANFLRTLVCSSPVPSPVASPVPTVANEWSQFGQNAQHTSYTSVGVNTPWKYKWQWNGAGADGKKQAGHVSAPDLVQPITGGGRVYMIAGNSVYALDKLTGNVVWSKGSIGTLSATPAYDSGNLYVPSSDGKIYKLNAATGSVISSFTGASAFNLAVTFANGRIYAVSSSGVLYALDPVSMAKVWEYAGGSIGSTPVSYSPSKNILVYLTQDLYVHGVDATTGLRKWRNKPTTTRTYQSGTPTSTGAQAEEGWPVIAEQHGVVFVRYRLDWDTLWTWSPYPTTNSQIRENLVSQPQAQALFALNITNGTLAFVPAVGNGGAGDGGTLPMGPQPVIRDLGNGKEVAYIIWRNGLYCAGNWCDGRSDATMGEMVLDGSTVAGYSAGDMRFMRFTDIRTDEEMNITMANDTLFHSHWLINSAERITDRSDSLGATFTNPIKTTDSPFVIWRQCNGTNTCNYPGCTGNTYCGVNCSVSTSRYCSQGLYSYGDARQYPPGFYEYNNDTNGGSNPFTVVSDGMVLVKTNDGAILALENGSPTARETETKPIAEANRTTQQVLGLQSPTTITYQDALNYMGQYVQVEGFIQSAVDHLPKAIYLGFTNPHDGHLLVRVFAKDISKFDFDLLTLKGKKIRVTGLVTAYWPEGKDPEIIVSDPSQIEILR